MRADVQGDGGAPALAGRILARVQDCDGTVLADLRFLTEWDKGMVPSSGSILRMRQLRCANPAGAAASRRPDPKAPAEVPAALPTVLAAASAEPVRAGGA